MAKKRDNSIKICVYLPKGWQKNCQIIPMETSNSLPFVQIAVKNSGAHPLQEETAQQIPRVVDIEEDLEGKSRNIVVYMPDTSETEEQAQQMFSLYEQYQAEVQKIKKLSQTQRKLRMPGS